MWSFLVPQVALKYEKSYFLYVSFKCFTYTFYGAGCKSDVNEMK